MSDLDARQQAAEEFHSQFRWVLLTFAVCIIVLLSVSARDPYGLMGFMSVIVPVFTFIVDRLATTKLFFDNYFRMESVRMILGYLIFYPLCYFCGPDSPAWLLYIVPIVVVSTTNQIIQTPVKHLPDDYSYMIDTVINYKIMALCLGLSVLYSGTYYLLFRQLYTTTVAFVFLSLVSIIVNWAVPFVHKTIQVNRLLIANRRLQQRTNAAIEASIQKTQFIATLSHELRTPLHGVIACADMLRHTTLDDSQTSFVKIIAKSSNILLGLISNILDLAKIESGKMDLEVKSFSLHDTLTSVTSLTKINKTNSAKVILHTDNIPEFVTGDESRLTQVLINLINNALKFSYGTSDVTVNVSKLQETDSEYELLFHVTDKGIGIEMNSHELLFHSYFQADSSISRRFGGTGLGLSICQKILSLMRGKIWLEKSVPNEGSTFAFTCWMGKSADINRPVSPLPETKYQIKDLRLLVAEDNNINRKVMSKMLEKIGVQHFTMAKDGEQGFIEYTRQEYDIVLTDLSMPVMNGLDLARAIRDFEKKDNRKRCMIVAITANATEETQKECEASGMDKFVTKPILTDALNSILTKLL